MKPDSLWLLSLPPALLLVFHIAALIFLLSRRSDGSAAKSLATTAFALFLMTDVAGLLARMLVVRVAAATSVAFIFGVLSWCSTLVTFLAFSLLIGAVCTGRSRIETGHRYFDAEHTDTNNPCLPPSN